MMTFTRRCLEHWWSAGSFLAAACILTQAVGARGQATILDIRPNAERKWVDAWAVSYLPTTVNGERQAVPTFDNQTLRLNMFVKLGGTALRVKLTNRFSTHPLVIGAAHIALQRTSSRKQTAS